MIFLSHNHKDKTLVRQIAETLEKVYEQDKVFYDEWSIQPGDSIIQQMNEGLTICKYFFFFVSKNSLMSKMVELEWQSALVKKVKENIAFVPVRIDNCIIPQILANTLYIDLFTQGLDVAKRQIVDVINGTNTYRSNINPFHNVIGYITNEEKKVTIEFRAEYYMEPHSEYAVLLDNNEEDLDYRIPVGYSMPGEFRKDVKLGDDKNFKGTILFQHNSATSPGFPVIVELTQKTDKKIKVLGLMRVMSKNKGYNNYGMIPANISFKGIQSNKGLKTGFMYTKKFVVFQMVFV